jgi:hypothetical protein
MCEVHVYNTQYRVVEKVQGMCVGCAFTAKPQLYASSSPLHLLHHLFFRLVLQIVVV